MMVGRGASCETKGAVAASLGLAHACPPKVTEWPPRHNPKSQRVPNVCSCQTEHGESGETGHFTCAHVSSGAVVPYM